MRPKPLTEARARRIAHAAAARENFNDLRAAAKPANGGKAEVERQLEVLKKRPR